jgi:hypothetical protein
MASRRSPVQLRPVPPIVGDSSGLQVILARSPCGVRLSVSPPISRNFPIVQWQDTRLLTGESWFESTSGSQIRGGRLREGHLPLKQGNRGSNPRRRTNLALLAQLDRAPVYEAGSWGFKSLGERHLGTFAADETLPVATAAGRADEGVPIRSACRGAWPSPRPSEGRERWFKSTHADQTVHNGAA